MVFSTLKKTRNHTGWIGIDVGTNLVKLAQVEKTNTGYKLVASSVAPIDCDVFQGPPSQVSSSLTQALNASLSGRTKFRGRQAACVLSISSTERTEFDLPSGSEDELREMVELELTMTKNESSDNIVFDFWQSDQLSTDKNSETAQVTILHAKRQLVDSLALEILRAGVTCEIMDGLPQALARITSLTSTRSSDQAIAAVDWGFSNAFFVLIKNGKPAFTRLLRNCGTKDLLDSMSQSLGLSHQECQYLLTTYGVNTPDHPVGGGELQLAISELISSQIDCMVQELEKTTAYLQRQFPELMPERLLLFGGGATTRNISENITAKINLPSQVWPPRSCNIETEEAGDLATLLGPAIALSILGLN